MANVQPSGTSVRDRFERDASMKLGKPVEAHIITTLRVDPNVDAGAVVEELLATARAAGWKITSQYSDGALGTKDYPTGSADLAIVQYREGEATLVAVRLTHDW